MRILILIILSGSFIYPLMNSAHAQLEPFGLDGKTITAVSLFPSDFNSQINYLCAGTDSGGVFLRSLASADSPWVNYGLSDKNITTVYVYLWGAGPVDFFTLFAGSRPSFASGDSTLLYHRTFSYDTTWGIADSGLNAAQLDHIRCISGIFFGGHEPPQPLFLGAAMDIFGSNGFPPQLFWQTSWSGGAVLTLEILQRSLSFPYGIVWAGGVTNAQTPFFVKSMDAGNTWTLLPPPPGGDNECHSIAIDPLHPDTVYAGMRDVVLKTTNGGQNWVDVSPPNSGGVFFGVEINPTNPEHLMAGGTSFPDSEFVLFETHDGGNSWTEILPGQTIAGITAMDSHVEGAEFVVYMGTGGDGVYRYKSPVAGIKEEPEPFLQDFTLYQNFPNPFNPSTVISWQLPVSSDVELIIYDLPGKKVRELVNEKQPAGYYEIVWDGKDDAGKDLASGVYVYRMKVGKNIKSKKMLLIH